MTVKAKASAALAALTLSACVYMPPAGQAYWQRVEDNSALYMIGPKAQQQLDEDIASCVRQVDELVELGALRQKMPPDTHAEYRRALDASGDLSWYDTPTRFGDKKVAHKNFQDFEGCMRHMGWERVRQVRYQSAVNARSVYSETQDLRRYGGVPGGAYNHAMVEENRMRAQQKPRYDFGGINR